MIFLIAWRNVWRNKSRSVVIMLSVAVGLLAGIGVLALYKGMMYGRVRTVIDSEVAHLQLHDTSFKLDYDPSFVITGSAVALTQVRALPGVKIAAPRSIVQGMIVTTTGSAGVQVNGVQPDAEYAISRLKKKIITGTGFRDSRKNEILIGKKLSEKMKLKSGSKIVLTFTDTADNIVSSAFRVAGIYQSGNAPLDEVQVYIHIATLNDLLLTGDQFHEIAVLLQNDEALPQVQQRLKQLFPSLLVESWKDISPETEFMVRTVDDYSYIIMVIIFIALAFGILNTMLMSVLERTREIGMMVALGTSRLRIFLLVFLETAFLTLAGSPIGLVLAYVIITYFNRNGLDLSGMGKDMMESFGFSTMIYPAFPWEKLAGVVTMVVITAILSCLLPAVKAVRLQPVEALRQ